MRVGADIGGTFTDLVAFNAAQDRYLVSKALNHGDNPQGGFVDALEAVGLSAHDIQQMVHGTTIVTNLLIEGGGASVGLITTRGFRDVLEIQLSWRPRSIDIWYEKTPPIIPRTRRIEVGGRVDADGLEVENLDEEEVELAIASLLEEQMEALAVALYNSYANPAHEEEIMRIASRVAPGIPVTLSSTVDGRIGEYPRFSTTALNAMAVPRMRQYVADLGQVVDRPIMYMQSAGGIVPATEAAERPIQLAFSGPGAGVLAAREVARELGFRNVITMDMGGTSCDVSVIWDDELRFREQIDIAVGVPARVRSVDARTIGAGGGSVAWCDTGGVLNVGPRSAGALPGPACYGNGGTEPTVTDANLVLGILPADGLLGGSLGLNSQAAAAALEELGREFGVDYGDATGAVYRVVNANMAQAIREMTVTRGIDPRECALIAFGGAGPQHASGVAAELGIPDLIVPADASVLSAIGLLNAEIQVSSSRSLLANLEELDSEGVDTAFHELIDATASRLDDLTSVGLVSERFGGLRYTGQSHEVAIPLDCDAESARERFEQEHERLYGTRLGDEVEIANIWVTLTKPSSFEKPYAPGNERVIQSEAKKSPDPKSVRRCLLVNDSIPVYDRAMIGGDIEGPCLIEEPNSVTVVLEQTVVSSQASHLVISVCK